MRSERSCREAIREIVSAVERWMEYAQDCGVGEERAKEIGDILNQTALVNI